jgi:quinol monooxygenase YgiN
MTGPGLAIIGSLQVAPEDRARWLVAAHDLVVQTRQEPGTVEYAIGADLVDPSLIVFYERYQDPEALHAHLASAHFEVFAAQVKDIPFVRPPQSVKYFEGESYDSGKNALVDE